MNTLSRSEFDEKWMPEPYSGCWLWLGEQSARGYGRRQFGTKKVYAHRMSWTIYRGEIPADMDVLHHCDTPSCVNPDHLFLGTQTDNNRDKYLKGRNFCGIGELNGSAKLTEKQAREILAATGTHQSIADRFGVKQPAVSKIKSGQQWAFLSNQGGE